MRWLLTALLLWWACAPAAQAATYAFRSDAYAWETAATAVAWDRSCTGYPGDDDKATVTFSGGFTFPFAGTAYGSVRVLANGMLQFGADTGFFRNFTNTPLPAGNATARAGCVAGATARVLMAYWTDLDPSRAGSGNVTWEQKGTAPNRYVVFSWNGVYQYNTSTPYAFQIILYENGEFKYQYGNANATGSQATIGVQVSSTDYTQYSYNSGYNANGTAIRWFAATGIPARRAEYRLDELAWNGTVGEVFDSSGNGHHGVRVGGALNTPDGYVCRALEVPNNTDAATISAIDTAVDVDSVLGAAGSISLWYRAGVSWNSPNAAMLADATTQATRPFYLMRDSSGRLRLSIADAAGTILTALSVAQTFPAHRWVHVAASWRLAPGTNQSVLRLYINGAQVGVAIGTTSGSLDPGLATLFLGDNRSAATPAGATANSARGRLDEVRLYNYEISAVELADDIGVAHDCAPPLHHVEIRHASGSGLTCTPATLNVVACADAACASAYTAGVTGTLSAVGAGMTVNWPDGAAFTIAAGSSAVDVRMHLVTVGAVTVAAGGIAPAPTAATSCNFGTPACTFSAADSGLLFAVPHHVGGTLRTLSVSAVRKADDALACTPAFAGVAKPVTFTCTYANPASGTLPVQVGGRALNAANNAGAACDAAGQAVTLNFDASGVASTNLLYPDAGQLTLGARYSGSGADAGLVLTGSAGFVAAPAAFAFSAITPGPISAGMPFAATVTALNGATPAAAMPNFGRESPAQGVDIGFTRAQPTGAGASDGVFSGTLGAFAAGAADATNLRWSEVGRGDLSATLAGANYLGSGLGATGSTGVAGAVGRFVPHHFDVSVTPACSGVFSYAGQPFAATVTARNAAGATTVNYDGSAATTPNFAQAVTLTDAPVLGVGSFGTSGAVAASAFSAGVAAAQPAYSFAVKTTAPQTLVVRATDADAVSSAGFAEGSTALRSGRLRVANAFGSEKSPLQLAMRAEYWSAAAWVPNGDDGCTAVPAAAVALSNVRDHHGAPAAWTSTPSAIAISAGAGVLTLGAPVPAASGSVDIALNLGSAAADQSCLSAHPASTGAALPWLRSRHGSCAATWDRDPSARASFGIYSPESRKTIHVRDVY